MRVLRPHERGILARLERVHYARREESTLKMRASLESFTPIKTINQTEKTEKLICSSVLLCVHCIHQRVFKYVGNNYTFSTAVKYTLIYVWGSSYDISNVLYSLFSSHTSWDRIVFKP